MPSHDPVPPASHAPIFHVDDEETDRLLFSRLLQSADINVPLRAFARGDDLIDALIGVLRGAPMPLICFVDVKMAGMTGFDVLRWIRCQHAFDDLPVVMLSSSEEQRDLNEAQHFGAQCYTAKFPSPDHMRAIVDEAERVAVANTSQSFKMPCNLLHSAHAVA